MKDILAAITTYREERGWTEYQLAERSGLPQSTISSWYRKNMQPSLLSLDKIAHAFGLRLAQMLSDDDNIANDEKALLHEWNRLKHNQTQHLLDFLRSL